jgi:hypothetical protein
MTHRLRHLWKRNSALTGVLITGTLLAVCYGFALQLPFFFDDLPIMTWLRHNSLIDIWTGASESYYRPLAFTTYKIGQQFPQGMRQIILHGVSLILHWTSAILIMQIVRLCGKSPQQALLASILFIVFPFMYEAVPWVTAMPHPMVTNLALLATFGALKAEYGNKPGWWALSVLATTLAPFAHESGYVCAFIVGGIVIIQYGLRSRRRLILIALGSALNIGLILLRSVTPDVGAPGFEGLEDWVQNTFFFLHGLVYPVAPIIGWLAYHRGGHDFTLVAAATACLFGLLIWLARRNRDWRWAAGNLWWWLCASLPAAASLSYGRLYTSPRLYAPASAGIVMLWAGIIVELGKVVRNMWGRRLVWTLLAGAIVAQNVAFIYRQRELFLSLNSTYQTVLEAAENENNVPLGFVNLPRGLGRMDKVYAMTHESIFFVPPYSNVAEFIEVNKEWRAADAVMYPPVLQATDITYDFQGKGIDWGQMRQFAIDHRTVWLTRYSDGRFDLRYVGRITPNAAPSPDEPLVWFEGDTIIESTSVQEIEEGHWAVTIIWLAPGPVQGKIFVHIRDVAQNLVTQADGPALGGMVPPWIWQSGDRIEDVRHIILPKDAGPYTVQVGLFHEDVRFPAFMNDARCPDDVAPVATLE